jgi:enoyl-[acyl-carrier protein] reductase I
MLEINLKGKKVFIAGIGDDQGFGWAIAKAFAEAGAEILVGTWTPILNIFTTSLKAGKFDASRKLSNGSLMHFSQIYPLDASFDHSDDVPESIKENKRYKDVGGYTVSEVAEAIHNDHGYIDFFIHSLANGPEVKKPLLETTRNGYLSALSASSYSFISLLKHLGPYMNKYGAALTLTYFASEKTIPGYGGGMSSAKAALESDTRTLAWEAGRKWNIRVNAISAGPHGSRAAKAIGFIEKMIEYSEKNSPLHKPLYAEEVAYCTTFLCSPLASAVTGTILYVDNGLHTMGVAIEAPSLQGKNS